MALYMALSATMLRSRSDTPPIISSKEDLTQYMDLRLGYYNGARSAAFDDCDLVADKQRQGLVCNLTEGLLGWSSFMSKRRSSTTVGVRGSSGRESWPEGC